MNALTVSVPPHGVTLTVIDSPQRERLCEILRKASLTKEALMMLSNEAHANNLDGGNLNAAYWHLNSFYDVVRARIDAIEAKHRKQLEEKNDHC